MIPPNDESDAAPRRLRILSFATHASRGVLRHQAMRRRLMLWTVILALLMAAGGATFLAPVLDPKVRPGWFVFYWLACGWVTITAVLLAIFDLLLARVQAREEKRALAEKTARPRDVAEEA